MRQVRWVLLSSVVLLSSALAAEAPKQAGFHVKNAFTVKVPKGAQRVRVWFAMPQEDAWSTIKNLTLASDAGKIEVKDDSGGNRVGYLELKSPATDKVVIREEFDLVRTEMRTPTDASASRPLSDWERTALARYLQPTTHVVVNDRIKALAASIVGNETNPIKASRKSTTGRCRMWTTGSRTPITSRPPRWAAPSTA